MEYLEKYLDRCWGWFLFREDIHTIVKARSRKQAVTMAAKKLGVEESKCTGVYHSEETGEYMVVLY